LTSAAPARITPALFHSTGLTSRAVQRAAVGRGKSKASVMKIRNSLKSLIGRHRDNRLVRRKGRMYIINKTQKRYKARQG